MHWGLRILFVIIGVIALVYSNIELAEIEMVSNLSGQPQYEVNYLRLAGLIMIGMFFLLSGVSGRISLWWLKK